MKRNLILSLIASAGCFSRTSKLSARAAEAEARRGGRWAAAWHARRPRLGPHLKSIVRLGGPSRGPRWRDLRPAPRPAAPIARPAPAAPRPQTPIARPSMLNLPNRPAVAAGCIAQMPKIYPARNHRPGGAGGGFLKLEDQPSNLTRPGGAGGSFPQPPKINPPQHDSSGRRRWGDPATPKIQSPRRSDRRRRLSVASNWRWSNWRRRERGHYGRRLCLRRLSQPTTTSRTDPVMSRLGQPPRYRRSTRHW